MINIKDVEFFESKIEKQENGCWIWIGGKNSTNYGYLNIGKKRISSHRFSYMWYKGGIPKGMLVCHVCDNPICCAPEHLFLGTQKDNIQDALKKGRMHNMLGFKHTLDSRKKMSIAKTGTKMSEDAKKKLIKRMINNKYCLGIKHTEENKKKWSMLRTGRKCSEETKIKIGEKNRVNRTGKKASEETRLKMSIANARFWLGKEIPEELKLKMRAAKLGKKLSEEHKLKMKESQIRRRANEKLEQAKLNMKMLEETK
jgi:hypothetical protein